MRLANLYCAWWINRPTRPSLSRRGSLVSQYFTHLRHRHDHPPSDFKHRCRSKLVDLGDGAVNAKRYDKALSLYTAALSLDPVRPQDLLVKRSRVHAEKGKWKDALNDANEVIDFQFV